jgi:hypothetical protein
MPSLPRNPFQLHGGCFCDVIKYTISIPELSERPVVHSHPSKPLGPRNETNELLPITFIDHCNSCRRTAGSIAQTWLICPQSWVEFDLEPRSGGSVKPAVIEFVTPDKTLEELTFIKGFRSSQYASRTFCGRCGTHLTFHYTGPDQELAEKGSWGPYLNTTLGSLDEASAEVEGLRPDRHVWTGDGIGWMKRLLLDGESSFCAAKEQELVWVIETDFVSVAILHRDNLCNGRQLTPLY